MNLIRIICISSLLVIASCKKKDKQPEEVTSTPVVIPDTEPKCEDLPPAPLPFGWYDTIVDKNKSINSFLFDPVDPNKVIYVVNGDAFGYNKLYFYNVPSKQATYICTLGAYLPQLNNKGWITFSDVDNNVFLIKNAANIIQLTTNKHCHNPKWDYTGNYIYYFSEAYLTIGSQLVRIDTAGALKDIFEMNSPHFSAFKKHDKMLFVDMNTTTSNIILRDFSAAENDRILISGPANSKPGHINFEDLTLDNSGENFFWSNSNGIFKCNLSSLKIDTLLKNCPNFIYRNPIIAFKGNELTYTQELLIPLNTLRLFHQFRAMELDLLTKQSSEIKIFP